jgi:hypothetical protein
LSFIQDKFQFTDMKLYCLLLLILPLTFISAGTGDIIDTTAEIIKKGDAHELARTFSSSVEMTILGEDNSYSNTQAESVLTDFFKNNQPKSVKIIHRIASNPNYRFAVLLLTTGKGIYRTSFSLENVKGRFELNELRIEAEKAK